MEQEVLQRLLEAESQAESLTANADRERERLVAEALKEARAAEQRFEGRIPSIRSSFVDKAVASADQTLTELERRYEERHIDLRKAVEENEQEAVDAVVAMILDAERR